MKQTIDMTKGKEWKTILVFAIPIFFSNLFQTLYNIVDSIIVGNMIGKEALAAVSSSGNLIFLFNSFFIGLASGAGVVIAKYFGKNDLTNMRKAIHNDVIVGIISSIILTILGTLLAPTILKAMGTPENVLPNSISYFRIYFIGVASVILYNTFASILQALGDSRRPLIFLIISSLLNVGLDVLFISEYGGNLGVSGASLATILSQSVSAILAFIVLIKKNTIYQLKIKELKPEKKMLKEILYNGIPSGVQNSVIGLANVVIQSNINSFGSDVMSGCGAYSKIEGFAFLPITCFQISLATFVSQNLGAGDVARAKRGTRFAIITSCIIALLIGIIGYFLADKLIALFVSGDNAEEVIKNGVTALHTVCFFYPLLAFAHCTAALLRGSGHAIIPMSIMLLIWCVFRVIYVTFMMNVVAHELWLLYTAYPVTWGLSSIIYFIFLKWSKWYQKDLWKSKTA